MHEIWSWLLNITGVHFNNGASQWYNFWSGFGSDIGEVSILAGLVALYRNTRCHVDGCNRFGKHQFEHYKLCKKHHPEVPNKVTHLHIKQLHNKQKH